MIAYADVGSHGRIFKFTGGNIANRYPELLHIFAKKISPDLVRVKITIQKLPAKKGKK